MARPAGSHSRILLALVGGAAVGSAVNFGVGNGWLDHAAVEKFVKYVSKPIGDLFLNLLFLAIVPLVFASLALGVTRLGGAGLGRIGAKTLAYCMITTACAGVIGLALVNAIRPGESISQELQTRLMAKYSEEKAKADREPTKFGIDTLVNVVPKNPLKAFAEKEMLAVIFTALLVGAALTSIDPAKARTLIEFLEAVNAVTDFVIRTAMRFAPLGVFALIFTTTALFGLELLQALGAFVATVLAGLVIQWLLVFPPLVLLLGGMNPLAFFRKSRTAMITAFSTSSSSATLPTAMKTAEDELGIPANVSRFVLPLSATMNHNGTALFEAVTAVFLCQVFGVQLGLEQQLVILVLCVLTATGVAGVPGGSLPLIGMVVASVAPQVPPAAIGIVIGVDRILDMCRTVVNVTGDLTTALFVARSERGPQISTSEPV